MADENNEQKTVEQKQPKKGMSAKAKYITLGVLAAVLIVAIVLCVVFLPKANSDPKAVMEVSVNPDVQFVLDENNNVMNVVSLNADGEKVILKADFIGKSGEEAAVLFLDTCAKLGFFDLDSTIGREVNITISKKADDNLDNLKGNITIKVNGYFKDNGILAGAVVNLNNDLKGALVKISRDSTDYAQKTEQELLELTNKWSNELKDVSFSSRTALMNAISLLETNYKNSVTTLNNSIDAAEALLDTIADKTSEAYKTAKENLETLRAQLSQKLEDLNKAIQEKIKEFVESSATVFEQLKIEVESLYEAGVEALKTYKATYEANKESRLQQIEEYQASLTPAE